LAAGCSKPERYSEANFSPAYGYSGTPTYSSSSTTTSSADQGLTSQVQQSLSNDPSLVSVAPKVLVSAQNGAVTLSGNVSSDQEKQRIESLVKNTSGVVSVNNQLQVIQPTSDRPGQRIYHESTNTSPAQPTTPDSASTLPTTPDTASTVNAPPTTQTTP